MQRLNVLLVEDNEGMRALFGFMLAKAGHQVRAAKNGLEGLAEIHVERPDIVVTDIAMPVLDGLDLVRAVKSDDNLRDLPLVVITSYGQRFCDIAKSLGANAAIERPTEDKELFNVLSSVIAA